MLRLFWMGKVDRLAHSRSHGLVGVQQLQEWGKGGKEFLFERLINLKINQFGKIRANPV